MTGRPRADGPARSDTTGLAGLDADALWSAVLAAAAGSRAGPARAVAERCTVAGSPRLGWASPPPWRTVSRSVAAVRAALGVPVGARVVMLSTGGWCFAAQALIETTGGCSVLTPLDSLDPAAIAHVLATRAEAPRGVLAVSGSGATLETRLLAEAVPPRGGGRLVWLRDEGAPPEAFALSPRGGPDQVAMLGAPLSTAFLTAAAVVDDAALAEAYPRFLARCHRIGSTAARRAVTVPTKGDPRIRIVVPAWGGPGLRRWLLQLGRQLLGGKSGGFRPTVECRSVVEVAPDDVDAGPPDAVLDLGGLRRDLPALFDGLYAAGVFVACVGLRAGLDVVDHANVRAYKERLAHADADAPPRRPVAAADLPDAAATWLARRPDLTRLHVVGYWSDAERSLAPAGRFAAATGRRCEVHEGSAWNHHSFQAVYADPTVAVLIVTRGADAEAGASPPVRVVARTLREIAAATHRSLPERSLLVPLAAAAGADVPAALTGGD
ncbi:hypothetical protein ACIG87_30250 [Micromonospora sp. NPDC051925]|uniref:hypothetical protein n=1 Tax=Micromonospora sp. NPDC051925 TaxID=3364288 RepID=UPI0037C556EB